MLLYFTILTHWTTFRNSMVGEKPMRLWFHTAKIVEPGFKHSVTKSSIAVEPGFKACMFQSPYTKSLYYIAGCMAVLEFHFNLTFPHPSLDSGLFIRHPHNKIWNQQRSFRAWQWVLLTSYVLLGIPPAESYRCHTLAQPALCGARWPVLRSALLVMGLLLPAHAVLCLSPAAFLCLTLLPWSSISLFWKQLWIEPQGILMRKGCGF